MMDCEHVCRGKLPQIRTLGISSFCDATPLKTVSPERECFSAKVITYPEPKTVKESPPRYHQKNVQR